METASMSDLWCVHVLGPDDVHAAPSKVEAERAAAHLSAYWKSSRPDDDLVSFEVIPWPHSAESHAESVRFFYVETGLSPDSASEPIK